MQKSVWIFAFFIRNLSLVLLYNYMGWVNKNVWIDDDDVTETRITHFKFLRRVRRKTKIKRLFMNG
jgi:hypothetical protein